MRPQQLPVELGPVFSVREAVAAGVSHRRLRARDLASPFRGVRDRGDPPPHALDEWQTQRAAALRTLAAYATVMPDDQFFCGSSAAVVWDAALPPWLRAQALETPEVAVFSPGRTPRSQSIRGHTVTSSHASVRTVRGLRVTSPASTVAMLAAELRDVRDLVAVGDAMVRVPIFRNDPPALATIEELRAAVEAGRRPGIIRLREAVELVRVRSASPGETRCRVELVLAGLPEPELNVDIVDDGGRFIACGDLVYRAERVVVEYEGEHHRVDSAQWARDIERHERLSAAGWRVVRITKHEAYDAPWELVRRVRLALRSARRG